MIFAFKKYCHFIGLAFIVLSAVSCQKGGEPQPYDETGFPEHYPCLGNEIPTKQPDDKGGDDIVGGDDGEDDDGSTVVGDGSDDNDKGEEVIIIIH